MSEHDEIPAHIHYTKKANILLPLRLKVNNMFIKVQWSVKSDAPMLVIPRWIGPKIPMLNTCTKYWDTYLFSS